MRSILALLMACPLLAAPQAQARTSDAQLCAAAIERAEADGALPVGLLTAVAVSESGRYDRAQRGAAPWPWTVNNAGDGRYFASKAEAVSHVERLRAQGERNIDVGCMQINLMHHPNAFASLEEAFEPTRNVGYGAGFLGRLRDETRSWTRAVERYHTADPERGRAYREKVYERWQEARAGEPPEVDHPRGTQHGGRRADHAATGTVGPAGLPRAGQAAEAERPRLREPRRRAPRRGGAAAVRHDGTASDRAPATPRWWRPSGPPGAAAPDRFGARTLTAAG